MSKRIVTPIRMMQGLLFVPTVGLVRIPCGLSISVGDRKQVTVYDRGQKNRCVFRVREQTAEDWMAAIASGVSWLEHHRDELLTRRALKKPIKDAPIPGPGCPGISKRGNQFAVYDPVNSGVIVKPNLKESIRERVYIVELYSDVFSYNGLEIIA